VLTILSMEDLVKHKKQSVMLIITITLAGLVAGLLYGYACSVNPGLRKLGDKEYLSAMQSINVAIQNPIFFISFMGSIVAFAITTYKLRGQQAFYYVLIAMIIYIVGVFGVTMFVNVPLNNRLANFNISAASQNDLTNMRTIFERPWNTFHAIRTIASVASFVVSIIALIKINK